MFQVQAQRVTVRNGWRSAEGLPTFQVYASSPEEACEKALAVACPFGGLADGIELHLGVTDGDSAWLASYGAGRAGNVRRV